MPTIVALAETAEAETLHAILAGAPAVVKDRMKIATGRVGGAIVTSALNDPSKFWSRVLGLGVSRPITATVIDEIIGFYREHGNDATRFQVAPSLLPPDWSAICARHGLVEGAPWYKLICEAAAFKAGEETVLRTGRINAEEARTAASVLARGFGWPEDDIAGLYVPAFAGGSLHGYAAWEGDEMVAAAALRIVGEVGEMYGAATLPAHRGRGAQTALLAARAGAATSAGCKWLVSETWVPGEGEVNPSLNNMTRTGFSRLYARPNWRWSSAL